ncbi:2-amino-4-hydroxy-6-hydroxymethyldihydropteridine diphosphokinase [Cellulomonas sp. URHD0024]|uniref:2-amino-4-hydroxy-6- hydroxymethyldihydropteridine diphosphokinase n=1 Tax=Cellulomonas sp. URHD0024 TaxID=1302620 RepID=UPI00040761C9|nr:2-amino-4-hydroxy-6-hydroxymethyldihydropteridine diphosphokinase [Cellulomonas sp. URHD0024]
MTTDEQWEGGVLDGGGRLLDQIRLTGITTTGYHGVFEFERREGQTFVADVVVHMDTRRAAARDDLAHTLNYGVLAEQVSAVLSGDPVDLIETVAERIAATVLSHAIVQAVDVSVHKPQAPIEVPFGDVVVRIRRDRAKLPAAEPYLPRPQTDTVAHVRHSPTPTASFPVTPPPGAPVVAGVAAAAAAPVVPPTVPWSAIVPPIGSEPVPAPGEGPDGATAVVVPTTFEPTGLTPAPFAQPPGNPTAAVASTGDARDADARTGDVGSQLVETSTDAVVGEVVSDALDVPPSTVVDVVLALGANIGAAQETLRAAVHALSHTPGLEVVQVSPLARTAAVGGPEQADYLNAVVLARTMLAPRELLRVTQAIEQEHGRLRAERWGPRTLDVDIIVFGSVLAVTDDLELPHPRAHERAFVLEPWAQLDPQAVLPGLGGGPVAALAATAPDRDGIRWLALDWLTAPTPPTPPPAPALTDDGAPDEGAEAPRS